jgi:glycerol-3-phosphate dehydrogenase (NAD(P)+)
MSEIAKAVCPTNPFAVLTGPNLAGEIIVGQPTASVVASTNEQVALAVQSAFNAPRFRVYVNDDVVGCEVAGVVKNVIALAVGVAEGFGLGHNSRATLITRGLAEMTRLGVALGGQSETFAGLAGMGDLIATCSSAQSRNNSVGRRLGRGESLAEIVASMSMVAEGVKSAVSVLELAQLNGVSMPIVEQVVNVCESNASVTDVMMALLGRSVGSE